MGSLATAILGNVAFTSLRFLVIFLAGLGTSVLVARVLGPEDLGTYRLAMGVIWGLEVLSVLAFPNAVTKFIAEFSVAEPRRDARVLAFFLVQATVICGLTTLPLVLLADLVARFFGNAALAPLLVLGGLAVLPGVYAGMLAASMRGRQRFRELNVLSLWQSVASFTATAALLVAGFRLHGLFALFLVVNLLNLGLAVWYARDQWSMPRVPLELGASHRMWRYGLLMGVIAALGAVVWERSEVFFLGRYSRPEEVGFYSLSYTLVLQLRRALPTPLGEVLFPVIARLQGMKDEWGTGNALVHATRYLAIIACPMAVGGAIFAEPVIRLLYGQAYLPAVPVLAILSLSAAAVSLSPPAAAVLVNKERYRFLLISFAILSAGNIALDFVLIPRYAALGAAVANTMIQIVGVAAQLIAASRLAGTPVPVGTIGRCLLAAGLAALAASALGALAIFGPWGDLPLMAGAFLMCYLVGLRGLGVFVSADIERLHALEPLMPRVVHRFIGHIVGAGMVGAASRRR